VGDALPPLAPAAPAARSAAVGGVYVAVEGRTGTAADAVSAPSGIDPRATRRQVRDAGQRAALAALPLPGALLLALLPWAGWALVQSARPWALPWGLAVLGLGLAMTLPPRARKPGPGLGGEAWPAWLALAAAGLAALVWGTAGSSSGVALAAMAMVWAAVTAVALAPWRRASLAVAWLPLAAGGAAGAGAPWLAAGALATAGALAAARLRLLAWQRGEHRRLTLEARARQLETERDEALRSDEEKSRFVAIASHDLRQPVHALGLFAATLQKRLQHTPDEALVRNFLRAVDDLERSFSSMLDISRLDGDAAAPQLHTFPLRDLFRRLQMQYAGQAELSGLGLRFSPGGKSVTSDPQLLERIVGNLVHNAIKYTAQGGVVVVARSTATHVNVEIWDTGAGIPADELPRVFQEFYQVTPGRRDLSHGLGMGLAIVKRLARLLGHRLEVASRPGRGTMFRVGIAIGALPGIQDELAPADTLPMQVLTPQMVLIVDDEEPIREGLRVLLQAWGYQTITAANAAEAEQAVLALEGRVDLVLSDLQLGHEPGDADGIAVVDNVRRLCGYAVPAVLVTGDTSHQAVQALARRGDPVLFKPVQPRRLFDAMRAALG
jgi:signal transduction histidine kinase/CheY-like chemotaxis protein